MGGRESNSQIAQAELLALKLSLAVSCQLPQCVKARRESGVWQQWDFPAPRASTRCSVQTGNHISSQSCIFPAAVPSPHCVHTLQQQDLSSASIEVLLSQKLHLLFMGKEVNKKAPDGNYSFCCLRGGKAGTDVIQPGAVRLPSLHHCLNKEPQARKSPTTTTEAGMR